MSTGIILLSHGSRLPEAQATVRAIRDQVVAAGNFELVEIAALQFNQPDLPAALKTVVESGATKVIIMPLFLYQGLHMQKDIPDILKEQRVLYPKINITVTDHIGADPLLAEIIHKRIREVKAWTT
jgi:sirohydrochlorin ferrochelatase